MQDELGRAAKTFGDEVLVDGQRYRRHASGTVRYHTLCGAVRIRRHTYRLVGVHNGPTVVPLELQTGLVENATPALARSVLQAFAAMPLRHYEDEMRTAHRSLPSRSTLERISKRMGSALHEQLPIIEPVVRSNEKLPREAASISVGLDRTTIPMAEQLQRLPERWHRKRHRRPPPPVTVAYRMAYVATVAVNDALGDTITSKRIAATADEGPVEMMERLGDELQHLLQQRELPIVVVQDGAPELWNLVEEWFANFRIPIEMNLVDRYHVEERLAQLAEVFERKPHDRAVLLNRWRSWLDRSDNAIRRICRDVEQRTYAPAVRSERIPCPPGYIDPFGPNLEWEPSPTLRISEEKAKIVNDHLRYCTNIGDRTRYATARRRGFPIGSGVTEGACKSVITTRMKRSGQRWFEYGASACLQLRTLYLNGRLDSCFEQYIGQRRSEVRLA